MPSAYRDRNFLVKLGLLTGKKMKVFGVLLIFCCCKLVVVETTDDHPLYNANGIVCNKCPPGTYVEKDCTKNYANPICKACPDHHYMDKWNDKGHCFACKSGCPSNGLEVQVCNKTANRVCLCEDGFHRHPLDTIDDHWKCKPHSSCEPGYGEKHYGNHSHDTVCEECEEGQQFVNTTVDKHPRCQACSLCVNGTYPLSSCTVTFDTECSDNATDVRTTDTPASQKDSEGLGGGVIAGIVVGIIAIIVIIIVIIICLARRYGYCKRDNESMRSRCPCVERGLLTRWRARRKKDDSSKTNTTDNGETSNRLLPLNQNWTEGFIARQVCPFLSRNVGHEWRQLIPQLPGWPEGQNVNTIIEHKEDEERAVANRILGCLNEWMKRALPQSVNRGSIVEALTFVERADLIEQLDKMASDQQAAAQTNGQA